MRITKKEMLVTRFVVAKTTKVNGYGGEKITYKKGRILETIRNRNYWYHPTDHVIVFGHGINGVIPVDNIKAVWSMEITKTITITKKVAYEAPKRK